MKTLERVKTERRMREALRQTFDTGNSLSDAWDQLLIDEDAFEIELALMDIPVVVAVNGRPTRKDMKYYVAKLQDYFLAVAIDALDFAENNHVG